MCDIGWEIMTNVEKTFSDNDNSNKTIVIMVTALGSAPYSVDLITV